MDDTQQFIEQGKRDVAAMAGDSVMRDSCRTWLQKATQHSYTHHFTWMGRPIIQLPQDMIAMQQIIWAVRPRIIIETGIARGGSLVYYASLLELIGEDGIVLGIDVDIREHNRGAIDAHPMRKRIEMIEGSSIASDIITQVHQRAADHHPVLVVLDSNHTHDHVLAELQAYAPLVTRGSYLVVYDTAIADVPPKVLGDRPWGPGNNPKTAVHAFLESTDRFEIDRELEHSLMLTVAPDGYLRCVKD